MPEENLEDLKMRVVALEDKLRKIYITEEELQALNITEEELKTFQKVAAALAAAGRGRPLLCVSACLYIPPCHLPLQIVPPCYVGYPVPSGGIGFGSLGS